MRVVRVTPEGRKPSAERIFVGAVATQSVIGDDMGRDLRLIEVHFRKGARNKLHAHTTDQILVVTEGEGIVATESERHEVSRGDVALIPAGERHWHGARPDNDMTHLAINGHGSKTSVVGESSKRPTRRGPGSRVPPKAEHKGRAPSVERTTSATPGPSARAR